MDKIVTLAERTTEDRLSGVECKLLEAHAIAAFWPAITTALNSLPQLLLNDTPESFYKKAMETRVQVWIVGKPPKPEMVIFTQVAIHPKRRVLEVTCCFGDVGTTESVGPAVDAALDEFAREQDCSSIEIFGRPGWVRVLAPWGFSLESVVLSRPVTDRSMN